MAIIKKKTSTTKATTKPVSKTNPEFELFETLVDTIRKEVKKTVDYRTSVNDVSPDSIYHYTHETIKGLISASKWA